MMRRLAWTALLIVLVVAWALGFGWSVRELVRHGF